MRYDEKGNVYPSDLQGRDRSPITLKNDRVKQSVPEFPEQRKGKEKNGKNEGSRVFVRSDPHAPKRGGKKTVYTFWLFFFKKS